MAHDPVAAPAIEALGRLEDVANRIEAEVGRVVQGMVAVAGILEQHMHMLGVIMQAATAEEEGDGKLHDALTRMAAAIEILTDRVGGLHAAVVALPAATARAVKTGELV